MNLNNLTRPVQCLAALANAIRGKNIYGLTRVTEPEALEAGYLHAEFRRAHGVSAELYVNTGSSELEEQKPFRSNGPTVYARVYTPGVTMSVGHMTCKPSIAIAQAVLACEVAELGCLLEAMLDELTVGFPTNENGKPLDPDEGE